VVIDAYQERQKQEVSNAILTGYYAAYYTNGGKKAKNPNDLIAQMYAKSAPKQSFEAGLKDIQRLMELEQSRGSEG